MTEQMNDALKQAAEEFDDSMYRSDCFIGGVNWYLDNVWHPASKEPDDKAQCLVISNRGSKDIVTYSNQFFYKGHVVAEPCKLYRLTDITRWAYTDDLFPNKQED